MNSIKYRKLYLAENWAENGFIMIKEKVNVPRCFPCPYSINFQRMHPRVLSGEAFWITHNELCTGYYKRINPDIFRPIFSYKRQKIVNELNSSINSPNLKYARKKYFFGLDNVKIMPLDCVENILSFINIHL